MSCDMIVGVIVYMIVGVVV